MFAALAAPRALTPPEKAMLRAQLKTTLKIATDDGADDAEGLLAFVLDMVEAGETVDRVTKELLSLEMCGEAEAEKIEACLAKFFFSLEARQQELQAEAEDAARLEEGLAPIPDVAAAFRGDLASDARRHVEFLRALHDAGVTRSPPSNESMRRYVDLWLPFVHKMCLQNPTCQLVPPDDVAWIWHCHRLAPYQYLKYVRGRFGVTSGKDAILARWEANGPRKAADAALDGLVDPSHPFSTNSFLDLNSPVAATRARARNALLNLGSEMEVHGDTFKLFKKMYPGESFRLDERKETPPSEGTIGYDIASACERQKTFLWQVTQPNFSDEQFLREGVENYLKFVRLMKKKEHKYLVPTYQIDLMWHTHILSSLSQYHRECMAIAGTVLDHDDSLNDRAEGGQLDTNFRATCELWRSEYGEDYAVPGGMYRGEPPKEFWEHSVEYFVRDENTPWMDINHPDAFIAAKPKSKTEGVNNNPCKGGYIFGKGSRGAGYYNLQTKESYRVLLKRIEKEESDAWVYLVLFMFIFPILVFMLEQRKLNDARKFARAQLRASGPNEAISLPKNTEKRLKLYRRDKPRDSQAYGYAYDSSALITVAGGCGGGGSGGGGCGAYVEPYYG
ncbi:hypothetical protein ACHAXT_009625 [Thalassiosira profunda]